mmetsp:Transcript_10534/g.22804  ORF Transcript_10534/g.22804 Transcript_10534/m.22804 type:complete len:458 (+) Transcript_10534:233-1606(+)
MLQRWRRRAGSCTLHLLLMSMVPDAFAFCETASRSISVLDHFSTPGNHNICNIHRQPFLRTWDAKVPVSVARNTGTGALCTTRKASACATADCGRTSLSSSSIGVQQFMISHPVYRHRSAYCARSRTPRCGYFSDVVVNWRTWLTDFPSQLPARLAQIPSSTLRALGVFEDAEAKLDELLPVVGIGSVALLLVVAVTAAVAGLITGDRTRTEEQIEARADDELVLSAMPKMRAAAWDRGEPAREMICVTNPNKWCTCYRMSYNRVPGEERSGCSNVKRKQLPKGVWLELLVCILIDLGGDASYFYPSFGEVADVPYAFFYAYFIDLLFNWPVLASAAFWKEILPYTDLIPAATLGWMLTTTGVRLAIDPPPRKLSVLSAPIADRRSYLAPDPHLRPELQPVKGKAAPSTMTAAPAAVTTTTTRTARTMRTARPTSRTPPARLRMAILRRALRQLLRR